MLRSGDTLGEYEIVETIGQGAMGTVYLARHRILGRTVALKVLLPHLAAEAEFRERFRREARALAEFDHPGIVPVYEARELDDGTVYIAMRHMAGGTLADRIARGPIPLDATIDTLEPIASALDELHRRGFVHRDIKPSNILFDADGRAFLGDFGILKSPTDATLTVHAQVVGTLRYTSPERFRGATPDPRSDLYSLGVVAYECLNGAPPFNDDTEGALIAAHLTGAPPPLNHPRSATGSALDRTLNHALAKEPDERPESAGQFLTRLSNAASSAGEAPTAVAQQSVSGPSVQNSPTQGTDATKVDTARPAPASTPPSPRRRPRANLVALVVLVSTVAIAGGVALMLGGAKSDSGQRSDDGRMAAALSPATSAARAFEIESYGRSLFVEGDASTGAVACGACHTLKAAGTTGLGGPDLDKSVLGTAAAIRDSIVDPDAEIAHGYAKGIMPNNYALVLDNAKLEALSQFLVAATQ